MRLRTDRLPTILLKSTITAALLPSHMKAIKLAHTRIRVMALHRVSMGRRRINMCHRANTGQATEGHLREDIIIMDPHRAWRTNKDRPMGITRIKEAVLGQRKRDVARPYSQR